MTATVPDDAPAPLELDAAHFLLGALGDAALWRWLFHRERTELRGELTKSFKNAPAALRHGLVRNRFARHLQRHEKNLGALLKLWAPSHLELLRELQSFATQNAARVLATDAPKTVANENLASDVIEESTADAASKTAPSEKNNALAASETALASENETAKENSKSADFAISNGDDAAQFASLLNFDFPDEDLQTLRARFGEHALQLARIFLETTPPDDEIFASLAPPATASTRSERESATAIFSAHGTPSHAEKSVASRTGDRPLQNLDAASTRAARGAASEENSAPDDKRSADQNRAALARDEAARETLKRQLQEAKAARDTHKQRARELSTEIETLKTLHQRELHEVRAQLIQAQKDAAAQREKFAAAQKSLERETRRARSENAHLETFEAENKSLKRQLRQSQQSAEDARKTAASAATQLQIAQDENENLRREIEIMQSEKARAESLASTRTGAIRGAKKAAKTPHVKAARVEIEAVKVAPIAPRVLDPLDEVFRWNSITGDVAVTLRETREMISRNDETRVFALSRALEVLRENDEKTYLNFLARVREFGVYFRRVLTAPTTRVLVDASNIARIETDRRGRGQLDFLLQAREELRRRDAFPLLLIADASLQHFIDEPAEVAKMAARGELELLPAGNVADDFLAREARRTGAFVLTNDKRFHQQVAPDFEPSRVGFKLRHNFIEIDDF